jgi:hypothetical protein
MQTEMDHSRDQIQKDFRRNVSLKHKHYSRRVVTAGDAVSWHDRIRVPAAAHDMDEAWGRACSTTYKLPNFTNGHRNNAEEWKVDGLRLWIEVGAQTATTQTERGRSEEAMMAAHAAEIAGQRQHRMVTKGEANGNGP